MNLPLINTDNVGNSYYGWRTNNLIFASDSKFVTFSQIANWVNQFFGQTCLAIGSEGGNLFNLILPTNFETLTLPATPTNRRFRTEHINASLSNGDNSQTLVLYRVQGSTNVTLSTLLGSTNSRAFYGVLNNRSLSLFRIATTGAGLDNSSYQFFSIGWLSNPLYSGSAFIRNAYYLSLTPNQIGAGRPSAENTEQRTSFQIPLNTNFDSIANYSVTCQTATPGANTTELYLRDSVAPNKAIGYVPNLLKTSLQIPVGQIYRNTGIDPDGSNMNTWICVGVFGTERILMRVWTEGLA